MQSGIILPALYDQTRFPQVSARTRIDITGAIGIDIEGLTEKEGGKFTQEQLCTALRYLLTTNPKLHAYMETKASNNDKADILNPFFVPDGTTWLLPVLMLNHDIAYHHSFHHDTSNCDCGGGSCPDCGENAGIGVAVIGIVCTLFATCAFLACAGKNTADLIISDDSILAKFVKLGVNLLSFLIPAVTVGYLASYAYGQDHVLDDFVSPDPSTLVTSYFVNVFLPLMVGSGSLALTSYLVKHVPCASNRNDNQAELELTPNDDVLAELETVKNLLENNYVREGDDPEQCREFIKETVRYYIQSISATVENETKPLLKRSPVMMFNGYTGSINTVTTDTADVTAADTPILGSRRTF